MILNGFVFDLFFYTLVYMRITLHNGKNVVMEGCARGEAYLRPHITDVFVMCRVVEQDILEFIRPRGTKNWTILGESCHEFLDFFVLHKTLIPLVIVGKYIQTEGIKLRNNF